MALAAGLHVGASRYATLTEVMSPALPTADGDQLSLDQRAELTAARIRAQTQFRVGCLRHGLIEKAGAIGEVRARTPLGLALIDIEHRAIAMLKDELARRRAARRRR